MQLGYEGLVGWRYLLRRRRRPQVLLGGLLVLVVGGGLLGYGAWLQQSQTGSVSVFGNASQTAQILMATGGGISALGGCLTLFGLLNTFLTVFSAFSTFMITVGVAEVILVLGVMNGFQGDLRRKIIDTNAHVVIEPEVTGTYLEQYGRLADEARQVEGVQGVTAALNTEVMLSAPTNLAAVVLSGIDIETIGQVGKLPEHLKHGQLEALRDPRLVDEALRRAPGERSDIRPQPEEDEPPPPAADTADDPMAFPLPQRARPGPPPSLLVGIELKRNLALWPGEVINVISPFGELGPEGPVPKSRPFRVAGWFESGMLEFDSKLAYASLPAVQQYMGVGDVANAVLVRVANLDAARVVRDRLRSKLGDGVRVTDWQERNSNLFNALALEKVAMFLVLAINILLAAFSITSTLVMTIIERRREIAILMAMGSTRGSIVRIFMSQGGFTGAVGSLIGAAIGVSGGLALATFGLPLDPSVYYISDLPVDVRVADVVTIIVVAQVVSLVSTIYPALYASRMHPVEGLDAA